MVRYEVYNPDTRQWYRAYDRKSLKLFRNLGYKVRVKELVPDSPVQTAIHHPPRGSTRPNL